MHKHTQRKILVTITMLIFLASAASIVSNTHQETINSKPNELSNNNQFDSVENSLNGNIREISVNDIHLLGCTSIGGTTYCWD